MIYEQRTGEKVITMEKYVMKVITSGLLIMALISCDRICPNEYDRLKAENKMLQEELEGLKSGDREYIPQAEMYLTPHQNSSSTKKNAARKYITGPRGGCYYINKNGNKTYVDRSLCR